MLYKLKRDWTNSPTGLHLSWDFTGKNILPCGELHVLRLWRDASNANLTLLSGNIVFCVVKEGEKDVRWDKHAGPGLEPASYLLVLASQGFGPASYH